MQYQHRWHYCAVIFTIMLAIASVWIINPAIQRIFTLKQAEQQYMQKLTTLSKHPRTMQKDWGTANHPTKHQAVLTQLMTLANRHGVIIDTSTLSSAGLPTTTIWKSHLIAHGEPSHLALFLKALTEQSYATVISNFIYQSQQQNQTQIDADLVILKNTVPQKLKPEPQSPTTQTIWCTTTGIRKTNINSTPEHTNYPFKDMRMTGYLHQGNKTEAIITLPNTQTITATIGDVIGTEHVTITHITSDAITVTNNQGKQEQLNWIASLRSQ
jgi:Tfp pilus assembly protein PilP